jgi:hypothetical protein
MEPERAEEDPPSGEGGSETCGTTPAGPGSTTPAGAARRKKGKYGDLIKHALRWYLAVETPIPLPMLGVEKAVLRNLDVAMGHDAMRPAVKRSSLMTFERIKDEEKTASEWFSEYRRIHDEAPPKGWSSGRFQEHLKGILRDGLARVRERGEH